MTTASSEPGPDAPSGQAGPVYVVGVSGTSGSPAALRWAAQEARLHGAQVVAVRAWRRPAAPASTGTRTPLPGTDPQRLVEEEQARLESDVASVLGPDNGVTCRLVEGGRRKSLLAAAKHADLLVIDAPPQTSSQSGLLFAHRLVYAARCPVVIMPPRVARERSSALARGAERLGSGMARSLATAGRPGLSPSTLRPQDFGHDDEQRPPV